MPDHKKNSLDTCTRQILQEYFTLLTHNDDSTNLHKFILEQVEKPLIEEVLKQTKGNKLQTARMLGINRNTLHKKIIHYQIRKQENGI